LRRLQANVATPRLRSYRFEFEKLRLRMSRVMHLNALGQQALASALAPARESRAATLCLHARTKTVLAFARAL